MGKVFYMTSRRWILSIPVVAVLVTILSFLTVLVAEQVVAGERERALQQAASVMAGKLGALTVDGPMMGGAIMAGVTNPDLKRAVAGQGQDDDPAILAWLAQFRAVFHAPESLLTDSQGRIVAYNVTTGPSGTGRNIAFRPYVRRAMDGQHSVYVAVGTNGFARGVYFAAPITATTDPASPPAGVLVIKQSIAGIEALLGDSARKAVLLSPQGVVFASNHEPWLFRVAGPVDAERIAAIKATRQLSNVFDTRDPISLPFDTTTARAQAEGQDLAVATAPVEWHDPGGAWRLMLVEDRRAWLPSATRAAILTVSITLLGMLGVAAVLLLQLGAGRRAESDRVRKLSRAVEHSPIATVIADARRNVQYTNPRLSAVSGYSDEDLDGGDITVLADAGAETQGLLHRIIAAGQVWDGEVISRRKDGSPYWARWGIAPIRDGADIITHMVALIEDITERKSLEGQVAALNERLKAENLRLGAELDVSRRLQQMILPTPAELAKIRGLDVATFMEPANEVGGDYYDILPQDGGRLRIGIGDVTGHGLESGVVMLMTQSAVRTLVTGGEDDPLRMLDVLNRTLYANVERMGSDKNLTLALLDYRPVSPGERPESHVAGQIRVSGQHESIIVVRQGGSVDLIDTLHLGLPIGLVEDVREFLAEATILLGAGDTVVLYTDGITEAADPSHALYGLDRLCEIAALHWRDTAEAVKDAIIADVRRHIASQPLYDDLTLIVLKQG